MVNRIFICLSGAFSLVILNEFFYFFNFTGFSFGFTDLTGKYFYDLIIVFCSFFLLEFILSLGLKRVKIRSAHPLFYLLPAAVFYLLLCLVLNLTGQLVKDLQSLLCLLFCAILSSYQFFYSIFYRNDVK